MAQHDYVIDNQTAPNFRSDLNNALLATVSNNSGPSAPSTTYANMIWYDTTNNILKMRNEADDAWIDIGTLNQTTDEFEVANLTTLAESEWEAGTSTTEAIVSPAKVKAAIDALVPAPSAPTTSEVLSATAGAGAGAVGTYAFLATTIASNASTNNFGTTRAGSNLDPAGLIKVPGDVSTRYTAQGSTRSGTWRCMGYSAADPDVSTSSRTPGITLWLRIA